MLERKTAWQPIETLPFNKVVIFGDRGNNFIRIGVKKKIKEGSYGYFSDSSGISKDKIKEWAEIPR